MSPTSPVEILADAADTLHEKMLEAAEDATEATRRRPAPRRDGLAHHGA